ncbi:WbqC family protein [uncultured Arcticibacterium sp.]|uniref:WbqC family protein n=1 Tax=uncultured Arcticibacterium sp. TaxID=2173042 RepID=UPI0030F89DEE
MFFTPNFLPSVAYFQKIMETDSININMEDVYVKQTYRNRAQILGANKVENLIVPVNASSKVTPSKDVRIENISQWQRTQLRTIEAAYKSSAFYQFYDYLMIPLFEKDYNFLIDLQIDSLTFCLKALQLKKTICQATPNTNSDVIDIKSKVLPEKHHFEPYLQNFGNEFVPNLSIIDLLFCKGPEAYRYLRNQSWSEH